MARKPSTSLSGKPRGKRQSGYVVRIIGFVPVGGSFAEQRAVLDAMEAVENGDATSAIAMMRETAVQTKLTTRTMATPDGSA